MKRKRGLLITFEGTEGCGKTTQLALLVKTLKKEGQKVLTAREPGGTPFGSRIRRILLHSKRDMSREAEVLLYMASRAELVSRVILPALADGVVVICDRWMDATIAYQGHGLGVELKWIEAVGKGAVAGLEPDLSFFLDLDVETGLKRAHKRSGKLDRIEKRSLDFHRRVRKGYLSLARQHARFKRIPVTDVSGTHQQILKVIKGKLDVF